MVVSEKSKQINFDLSLLVKQASGNIFFVLIVFFCEGRFCVVF